MSALAWRAVRRHTLRKPAKFALAALGVALGVALAVAIDLANESVRRSFELAATAVSGRATHEITGGARGIPDDVYRRLRRDPALREAFVATPFVTATVALPAQPGQTAALVGVDALAEGLEPGGRAFRAGLDGGDLAALLTTPQAASITEETSRRFGVAKGGRLEIRAGARVSAITIAGVFAAGTPTLREAFDGALFVDIATAQELLAAPGFVSRVELRVREGAEVDEDHALAALAAALPAGVQIAPLAARTGALRQMTRAFELNLSALSLLALIVGAFLIFNTETFAVLERRPLFATLRTLGTTRGGVFALVLGEAAIVGAIGTALGLLLGVALARGLVHLVSRAITDLYFVVSVRDVALPAGPLLRGALLGMGAAVLSSIPAAREATRTEPRLALSRSSLEQRARGGARRSATLGAALLLVAALVIASSGRSLPAAMAALLMVVVGVALLGPAATTVAMAALGPALARWGGAAGRMTARNVVASLSRTGVAVSALLVALSVTVGVSLMVGSFRRAVDEWLGTTLAADVYVSAPALVSARSEGVLPADLPGRLQALDGVAALATNRVTTIAVDGAPALLMAIDVPPGGRRGVRLQDGDPARAITAFDAEGAVLVSEPFAYRRDVRAGGQVTLPTAHGPRRFVIAGVFRDYGSDTGTVMMSRRTYDRFFGDPGITAIALFAAPGHDVEALVARVRAALRPAEVLNVRSQKTLRVASLEVFDRTFEVTSVLRLVALVVAAFGVMGALMALELERTRELGVLRALGFTTRQVAGLVVAETGLLGLVAGLLATPLGTLLAALLVFVINRRSFGWTMELHLAASALAWAPLLGLVAGVVGGLYPALAVARMSPLAALRDE